MSSIGAYVLGALDPRERLDLERHLTTCEICRQELIEVAALPGLLHRLSLEDVSQRISGRRLEAELQPDLPAVELPPWSAATTVRPGLVRRLSRSRIMVVAVILVLGLATGGVASAELLTSQASQEILTWKTTDAASGIDTSARLASQAWGTDIRLWMENLPPGLTCRLVVYARTGAAQTAGWWSTNYASRLMVPGSTSIPLSQIDRIEVVRSDETALATLTRTIR